MTQGNSNGATGGGQRLWWREEIADATTHRVAAPPLTLAINEAAPAPMSPVLHAPVADADQFDTLWDELEAEAIRRADDAQTTAEARRNKLLSAATIPLDLSSYTRTAKRRQKRDFIAGSVFNLLLICLVLSLFLTGARSSFPWIWTVWLASQLASHWFTYRAGMKRHDDEAARDDWRVSAGGDGLTLVTPWTNKGEEETIPWQLIHDIKAVDAAPNGPKERCFCVIRRDGCDLDGKPVTPSPEDALSPREKRRLAWRRFLSKEPPAPKLTPPDLVPESVLPMSADALVARIAVWEAGQANAKF